MDAGEGQGLDGLGVAREGVDAIIIIVITIATTIAIAITIAVAVVVMVREVVGHALRRDR